MTLLFEYTIVATIITAVLGLVWSTKDLFNVSIKLFLLATGAIGTYIIANTLTEIGGPIITIFTILSVFNLTGLAIVWSKRSWNLLIKVALWITVFAGTYVTFTERLLG